MTDGRVDPCTAWTEAGLSTSSRMLLHRSSATTTPGAPVPWWQRSASF